MTSRIDEQHDKVREQEAHIARLNAKLEKCKLLTERLDMAKQWRARLKDVLVETGGKLENAANLASAVATDVMDVLAALDLASSQS